MALIEAIGLTKHYGQVKALEKLDVAVEPGIIGLVGANGAGKSTLLKILLGLVAPTSRPSHGPGDGLRVRDSRHPPGRGLYARTRLPASGHGRH
jgi:ABC-2 type transport system ATP-binding protein